MSTFFETFNMVDGDFKQTGNEIIDTSLFIFSILSYIVILIFSILLCLECRGERQPVFHPGSQFDPRENFDKIPVIIYQPFNNLKSTE